MPHGSVGNGLCNDYTNIAECNFDGGDCCGPCVITDQCSNCKCLEGAPNGLTHPFIQNGVCNDETNNVGCLYDGFDCCRSDASTEVCSECACHGKS